MPVEIINGLGIYYELSGGGEPLVFVHGYTGDITDWRYQLPAFAPTHRVLLIDNRGHGRSEASPDRAAYSVFQIADDVEALVAATGFDRYHLVGHSMGGAVAQEIAIGSPGRLLSLTLEDTSDNFNTRRQEVADYFAARIRLEEQQGMPAVADMPKLVPPHHMPVERTAETDRRLAGMSVDAYLGAWQGLEGWDGTTERAKNIAAPTMVICGALDAPSLVEGSRFLAATIPGAMLEIVPEAAHSPQFERPEIFNAALRRHLDRNAAVAAK